MITEEKVVADESKNGLVPYGSDQRLVTPHCKWCAGQGLSKGDDDLFDMHFKAIVDAMRRHEGKLSHGPKIKASERRTANSGLAEKFDFDDAEEFKLPALNVASWARWGAAQSVLALIVVAVIGTNFLNTRPVEKSVFDKLAADTYSTSTGSIKVTLTGDSATVVGVGDTQHLPIVVWHGTWQDEMDLLQGKFDHCNWLKVNGKSLATPDGMVLYNSHAPEIATVSSMRSFRDRIFRYYQNFGHYPDSVRDLGQDDTYINAVTKERMPYDIKQVINGAIVSSGAASSDRRCSVVAGHSDGAKQPGALWAVGVKSEPIIADDSNSYNWKNNSFYINGADSQGNPVKGGIAGKEFTIAMKNGIDISEKQTMVLPGGSNKVGFYSGTKPEVNGIRCRYSFLGFTLFLLIATTVIRLLHTRSSDGQLARLKKGRK